MELDCSAPIRLRTFLLRKNVHSPNPIIPSNRTRYDRMRVIVFFPKSLYPRANAWDYDLSSVSPVSGIFGITKHLDNLSCPLFDRTDIARRLFVQTSCWTTSFEPTALVPHLSACIHSFGLAPTGVTAPMLSPVNVTAPTFVLWCPYR